MPKILSIEQLSAGYDGRPVITDVNYNLERGAFLGVIGPNGGGKTTFIKSILGLIKPLSGRIVFYDELEKPVSSLRIGYLPQRKDIDSLFPISVEEVLFSGLMRELGWFRRPSIDQRRRVADVLNLIGLTEYRHHTIGELSGGQMQRVMLGRAIVQQPELLILDEPNSFLDMTFVQQLYNILKRLNEQGVTIVMVSHELASLTDVVTSVVSVEGSLKIGSLDCPYHHSHSDLHNHK